MLVLASLVHHNNGAYDQVLKQETRVGAACLAHSRRKFDELVKDNLSPVGTQAIQRIAALYQIERQVKGLSAEDRLAIRQSSSKPLSEDLHAWLKLERQRVPEGSATAKMHGHDPWAYLRDMLTRLPSYMNSRIDELLPHRWQSQS